MRIIRNALILAAAVAATPAHAQILQTDSFASGSGLICLNAIKRSDCSVDNAHQVIKVTCGGRGMMIGQAQIAGREIGREMDPDREYLKIICTIGRRPSGPDHAKAH
jgi:hypothetical protein